MSVNVGEMVSSVTPEPESPGQSPGGETEWQRAVQTRDLLARIFRDRLRTAAEGFDD